MININGKIYNSDQSVIHLQNRALNYGDALFEAMRFVDGRLIFGKDHINRLLSSMRMLRMEDHPNFSTEFVSNEITRVLPGSQVGAYRIKLIVWRRQGGKYTPKTNQIDYAISAETLADPEFIVPEKRYFMGVFDELRIQRGMLSALKTTNKLTNVLAGIYAQENQWDNCFLLNDQNRVVEAINGNIFLVNGKNITTPILEDGCLNGILRKQVLDLGSGQKEYFLKERSVEKEDLIKADEIWITNSISGIIPVFQFGEKRYKAEVARIFIEKLNKRARQL